MKRDCKHIWKFHPGPMWRAVVAADFMLVTVDNQLKQQWRPEVTIRIHRGTLKYESGLLVSQARSFLGRLHSTHQGKKGTARSSCSCCRRPQVLMSCGLRKDHCHRSTLCFFVCFLIAAGATKKLVPMLTTWPRLLFRTSGSVGCAEGNTYYINCKPYMTMPGRFQSVHVRR